jgi:hypothetical protein
MDSPEILTISMAGANWSALGLLTLLILPGEPPFWSFEARQLPESPQGLAGSICSSDQPPVALMLSRYQSSLYATVCIMAPLPSLRVSVVPVLARLKLENAMIVPYSDNSVAASSLVSISKDPGAMMALESVFRVVPMLSTQFSSCTDNSLLLYNSNTHIPAIRPEGQDQPLFH